MFQVSDSEQDSNILFQLVWKIKKKKRRMAKEGMLLNLAAQGSFNYVDDIIGGC